MPKKRYKVKPSRKNSGQFLILSALGIIIVMISFASLLAYTSVSRVSLERTSFRKTVTEVALNFRGALAASLAEVSKNMDHKASINRYENYTSLNDYPEAKLKGYEFITDWQKTIMMSYPGIGLNLSVSQPSFQCEWSSYSSYSKVSSNISLDILAYSFYGWKSTVLVELNVSILNLDLNRTDGKTVAFYFQILKENGVTVSDISKATAFIMFQHAESKEYTLTKSFNLTYAGGGYYLAEFSMYSNTTLEGLNEIKKYASLNMTEADFQHGYNSTMLVNMVDQVIAEYNNGQLVEAHNDITDSKSWIVQNEDTTYVLAWIDIVRSQIIPKVRVALQDSRGIVVGAARTMANIEEDDAGPITRFVNVSPNPTRGLSSVTLTASIDDLSTGFANIASAEYFVNAPDTNGTGIPLAASDGEFDSASEEVNALMDVSSWEPGVYTIYVHGKDEVGFWGAFKTVTLNVTEPSIMYVLKIDMYLRSRRELFGRQYWAEAVVTVVDMDEKPVEGVKVYGHWSGSVSGSVEGLTDVNGRVTFTSRQRGGRSTFTFTVDNLVKEGYVYNATLNGETSDTIRV